VSLAYRLQLHAQKQKVSSRKKLTLRRLTAESDESEIATQRDIVQAMQDSSAGVQLEETKRGKHIDKCFNGKDAIDWLISWYFASSRLEALQMASAMLRNGFFHAIDGANSTSRFSKSLIAYDKTKYCEFEDSTSAKYIFVSFAPVEVDKLFDDFDSDISEPEHFDQDDSGSQMSFEANSTGFSTHRQLSMV
jgi:hypothetical protein